MKLIYSDSKEEVKIGDSISVQGVSFLIDYFAKPHKPSSIGKVTIRSVQEGCRNEYYVSVIGAEWIEREDRE
jgi:hypothetical protein